MENADLKALVIVGAIKYMMQQMEETTSDIVSPEQNKICNEFIDSLPDEMDEELISTLREVLAENLHAFLKSIGEE